MDCLAANVGAENVRSDAKVIKAFGEFIGNGFNAAIDWRVKFAELKCFQGNSDQCRQMLPTLLVNSNKDYLYAA